MSTTDEVLRVLKDISHQSIHSKPEITIPVDVKRIRRLRENEAKAILASNPVVGGSVAARSQVRGHRLAEDLDIYVANPKNEIVSIVARLSQIYGVGNVKAIYVSSKKVTRISVRRNGKWTTVVDVKQLERHGKLLETVGTPIHKPLNIGGIQIQPIGELVARKAQGIYNSCIIPDMENKPRGRRCKKDLRDLKTVTTSVIRGLRATGKHKEAGRLQQSLIQLKIPKRKSKSKKKRHVESLFGFEPTKVFDF